LYDSAAMDQLSISPETSQGLQNLSNKDKQELNQFVMAETQKAQIQGSTSIAYHIIPYGSGD